MELHQTPTKALRQIVVAELHGERPRDDVKEAQGALVQSGSKVPTPRMNYIYSVLVHSFSLKGTLPMPNATKCCFPLPM